MNSSYSCFSWRCLQEQSLSIILQASLTEWLTRKIYRDAVGSKNTPSIGSGLINLYFATVKFLFWRAELAVGDFHWNQSKLSDKNLQPTNHDMARPGTCNLYLYNFGGFSMSDKFSGFCKGKKWAFSVDNLGWKVQFLNWKSLNIYASVDMRKNIWKVSTLSGSFLTPCVLEISTGNYFYVRTLYWIARLYISWNPSQRWPNFLENRMI